MKWSLDVKLKGVYCLLVKLPQRTEIVIGKLGKIEFKCGYYVYIGSALNDLDSRIERHKRQNKKFHWHIDYLLTKADVKEVFCVGTRKRKECQVAKELARNYKTIPKFGASDCKCKSHLLYLGNKEEFRDEIALLFQKNGLLPLDKNILDN